MKIQIRRWPAVILLIVPISSPLWTNVLLFRAGDFAVVATHAVLALAAVSALMVRKRFPLMPALCVGAMILLDLINVAHAGYLWDRTWLTSFAQFFTYASCFLMIISARLIRENIRTALSIIELLAIATSIMLILQYIAFNSNIELMLPHELAVGPYNPFAENRSNGQVPAVLFAREPYIMALGLTALLAVMMTVDKSRVRESSSIHKLAISLIVVSVVITFSVTGIIIVMALLGINFVASRVSTRNLGYFLAMLTMIAASVLVAGAYILNRFQTIREGQDRSAKVRVVASNKLLFAPLSSFSTTLFGTGFGLADREYERYLDIYSEDLDQLNIDSSMVRIHNVFTIVRFYQGWIGLGLYLLLLYFCFRPIHRGLRTYWPIYCWILMFHTATGYYLMPDFWAVFGSMALLRSFDLGEPPLRPLIASGGA